jgi:hypothetical protein
MSHATDPASMIVDPRIHLGDREVFKAVQQITVEAFGEEGRFTIEEDSEIPGANYVRVDVVYNGQLDGVVARHDAWHRRVSSLPGSNIGLFRLIINHE